MKRARKDTTLSVDVKTCARCGRDHRGLKFVKFVNPPDNGTGGYISHWATCVRTGEPILLEVVST